MKKNYLPIYAENKCTLFALGRNAIYAACRILEIEPGDEVLTPAFDCDGSLQPFKILNVKLNFFRSNPYTFAVDIDDIKKRITSKTKLIHIINHFGMPQPWDELLLLKKKVGIPILEDNAYSLFSSFKNRQFGTLGDMAIFSLRKNLPLIDGGLLRINNPEYYFKLPRKNIPWFYSTDIKTILTIIKTMSGYYKAPEPIRRFMRRLNPVIEPPPLYSDPERGYPYWPLRDQIDKEFSRDYLRPMSYLARVQLSRFSREDFMQIIDKKRLYYSWLCKKLSHLKGIRILWPELPEGIVPFCVSFLVESKRDIFFDTLRKKYDVMAWPTLPKLVLDELEKYPEVELLGRKLLQINLTLNKVRLSNYSNYLENLVQDIHILAKRNMQ